ncbi:hypothetical protein V8C42DRAFT_142950 [Trichoderma barbatum]
MAWLRNAVCDQFICATGVLCLSPLAGSRKKKKKLMPSSDQKKTVPPGQQSGFSMGAVGASLGHRPLVPWHASWPRWFFFLLLPWLLSGLLAQPLTSSLLWRAVFTSS